MPDVTGNRSLGGSMKFDLFRPAVMAAVASATMSASSSDALALANPYDGLGGTCIDLDYWRFNSCENLEGTAIDLDYWRFK